MTGVALGGRETSSLAEVVDRICLAATDVTGVDRCAIYLWNDRREAVIPVADHGTPLPVAERLAQLPYEDWAQWFRGSRSNAPLVLRRDAAESAAATAMLAVAGLHALAIVPLSTSGETIGWLVVGLEQPPTFDREQLDAAVEIARQAAPSIAHAREFDSLRKAAVFRARVASLAASLNAWNDRAVVAHMLCKRGAEFFGVDTGLLLQRDGDDVVAVGVHGRPAIRPHEVRVSLRDGDQAIAGVFRDARPAHRNDLDPERTPSTWLTARFGLRSLLAVPLVGRHGTRGCLVYGDRTRRHAFSHTIAEEGMLLAAVATGAVERAHATEIDDARRAAEKEAGRLAEQAARLRAARNAALEANEAKAAFLAHMSHEIRTPMTAILGYLRLLDDPSATAADRARHLGIVRRNGDHLLRLLNDILDLSKIEAGRMTVERTSCRPVDVLLEIASLLRPSAAAKGLAFTTACTGAIPETIETDPTRLRQILTNLVGNAIKFTDAGGVHLDAAMGRDAADRPVLRFEVADTGIGIPTDATERLFMPFTQVDASTTRRFGGTGLGLTISKRLAEMMGGDIVVRSRPGNGSVFALTVDPGALDGVAFREYGAADFVVAQPAPAAGEPATPLQARVLLVEDTPDTQELVAHLLRRAGARVDVADNGFAACERTLAAAGAGEPFDVVLMDMQMPGLDGEQATRRLRAAGYTRPIVALTAHALQSERERCLRAGCNDFVSKPIDLDALIELVRRFADDDRTAGGLPLTSSLAGDPQIMALLRKFTTGLPGRVAALRQGVATADLAEIEKHAHQLKGSCAGYGFPSISAVAARLERAAAAHRTERVEALVEEIAGLVARTRLPDAPEAGTIAREHP